jgi:hypothetical protein
MYSDPAATQFQPEPFPSNRPARRGPEGQLLAALRALGQGQGELRGHTVSPWASVTFTGSRHHVTLGFVGAAAIAAGEELIDALPDHEFTVPGHLVADAAIVAVEHTALPTPQLVVTMAVLLLEDC